MTMGVSLSFARKPQAFLACGFFHCLFDCLARVPACR
jgi:hypothetical protein